MVINWEPSTGQSAGYVMEIREKNNLNRKIFSFKKNTTIIVTLKPHICYKVSICAAYNEKTIDEADNYTKAITSYWGPSLLVIL